MIYVYLENWENEFIKINVLMLEYNEYELKS